MKFLFVHQNFPGQYLHLVRSLVADNKARDGTHEIVFMTEPNHNNLHGVRKVTYSRPPAPSPNIDRDVRDFDLAVRRARAAWQGAQQIKALGFTPDIIIGHHGWGEMLNLGDVFPNTPILGYFEFFYRVLDSDVNFDMEFPMSPEYFSAVRAKNAVNLQALALEQHGQVPTQWQYSTYPKWAQPSIRLIEEGVDLDLCKPDPALRRKTLKVGKLTISPRQKLITYVARNLEPYRGFHTFMRSLPKILDARPDAVVSIVGGDEVSYGAPHPSGPWREVLLAELKGKLDLSRIHFMGKVPYEDHLNLLKRSDAHVYLSYPFVASWSLREAMATGCMIVGADTKTVTEFISDRQTGLITPTLDHKALTRNVLLALEDTKLAGNLRANARAFAETHLDMADYLRRYRAVVEDITGTPLLPTAAKPKTTKAAKARGKP